ncbi:TetR family transcriptional regulator [Kitasatospora sp. NBC_01246]|uniref:ScbR family autoregulator-binding transcription factor n=1 Tax=Kitasatospora sp. NBC_01246 TaxID=2903570 RepID=UPI002E30ED2A|nr:ScbR family autoregulator-binding transcription factor [Kitasatospora sp. NBC_01246]
MAKQNRAVRTRQELIRSAAETFARSGFAESSITQICVRAGLSHGALHFHFGNKRALGEAVESAAAETLLHITGNVPLRHPVPLQLLVDTSHLLARRLSTDAVLRAGFCLGSDATWPGGADLWQQWQDWVQLMLTVARAQGSLAADIVLDDAVAAITAVVAGLEVLGRRDPQWHSRQAVTPFWRLMLPQLATAEARAGIVPEGSCAEPPEGGERAAGAEWGEGGGRRAAQPCDALSCC